MMDGDTLATTGHRQVTGLIRAGTEGECRPGEMQTSFPHLALLLGLLASKTGGSSLAPTSCTTAVWSGQSQYRVACADFNL
jgi:hypothetical protein